MFFETSLVFDNFKDAGQGYIRYIALPPRCTVFGWRGGVCFIEKIQTQDIGCPGARPRHIAAQAHDERGQCSTAAADAQDRAISAPMGRGGFAGFYRCHNVVLSLLSRHLPLALSQIDVAQSLRALRQKCQWPPTTELSVEVPAYGSTSRTWYGRPISYVVQERPNYQQASKMGAGGTGGAGGAGGVSYASGAASEANKHHAPVCGVCVCVPSRSTQLPGALSRFLHSSKNRWRCGFFMVASGSFVISVICSSDAASSA